MADQATIATAYVQLVPTLAGVQGKIGEAFAGTESEAEKAGKSVGTSFGGSMLDTLKVVAGPAAVAGALAGLFSIGSTFDDVSDSIRTATGKTGADLDGLVNQAKTIGTTIPVEFDKIGPALSQVSQKLGLTGSDLETVTSQFLALGNITGKEINLDAATASFSAFGVKGADVSGQLDTLFKISQQTGTGIDEITGAVQKSAPALQAMGFSYQDSAALVAQLDKAGLNVQGTLGGMGKALINAAKDGEQPEETFKRVTGGIADLVAGGKDAEAINLASTLFGTKGATQFVEATKNGALNTADLTAAVAASSETILGAQEDTGDFAESWTIFKNKAMVAIEPVATAVFNFAGQAMGALLASFEDIVGAISAAWDWMMQFKDVAIALGVVVVGLSANIILNTAATVANTIVTKAAAIATEAWAVAQKVLNLVLKDNPIGLIVAAIGLLVAGVIWAYQNVDWFRDLVDNAWTVISNAAKWAWENVLKPVFDALSGAVSAIIDWFSNFGTNVSQLWTNITDWISGAWNAVLTFFSELPGKTWEMIVAFANWIGEKGQEFIGWLAAGIYAGWELAKQWFLDLPGTLWSAIQGVWSTVGEWGRAFINWIWSGDASGNGTGGLKGAWDAVVDWFTHIPENAWILIQVAWATVSGWGMSLINWIWTGSADGNGTGGIKGGWDSVVKWFTDLPTNLWNSIKGAWEAAKEWGGQLIKFIIEGISGGSPYVSAELARTMINAAEDILPGLSGVFDLTGIDINKNIDDYLATLAHKAGGGYFGPLNGSGGGRIGMGTTGTADDVLIRGSRNEFMVNARSTAENLDWLRYINSGGRLPTFPGFADGGLVGSVGRNVGGKFLANLLPSITGYLVRQIEAMGQSTIAGTAIRSQDPSSFGWVRGANIVPFTWGGQTIGVAGGTEGLWRALLDALIPSVDGGLLSLGGYENRNIAGTNTPSFHSYGLAIDVNAPQNWRGLPGYGRTGWGVLPGTLAHALAVKGGMEWGGDWDYTDPMHFEIHLAPSQIGAAGGGGGSNLFSSLFGNLFGSASAGGGAGAEQWRALGLRALAMLGQPANLIGAVLSQIQLESSGNPRAINLGDSNARRGTPSKGLVQVIDPTFAAYALPGFNSDIYDPLSNLLAGMRWALASQGDIGAAWGHGRPYDSGGWLMPGINPVSMLRQPEPVLTPRQWDIAEAAITRATTGSGRNRVEMTVYQLPGQSPADLAGEIDRRLAFAGR